MCFWLKKLSNVHFLEGASPPQPQFFPLASSPTLFLYKLATYRNGNDVRLLSKLMLVASTAGNGFHTSPWVLGRALNSIRRGPAPRRRWDGGCRVTVPLCRSKHAEVATGGRLLTAFPGSGGKKVHASETPWEMSRNPHESQ